MKETDFDTTEIIEEYWHDLDSTLTVMYNEAIMSTNTSISNCPNAYTNPSLASRIMQFIQLMFYLCIVCTLPYTVA